MGKNLPMRCYSGDPMESWECFDYIGDAVSARFVRRKKLVFILCMLDLIENEPYICINPTTYKYVKISTHVFSTAIIGAYP